ncbi:probable serine/threonine-protein kinase DDB_G0278845 [Cataglyphis hispanica]|uniref:probable serine/threonine-protein kinase DDB_G0278845 n=1 Tax=Cataglyphis hispanica TaxID=1086592 RepID=UPI00217F9697|nr:probable serine/threonine-protein kinase DDB_G0278845 [Cataglyphis hispanica]
MIIVLFHVFYLFGQYIYKNYCIKRPRALCDAAKDTESSSELQNYEMFSDNSSRDNDNDEKPPTSKYREREGLKFDPPAYIQRYSAVQNILSDPMYKGQIRKVVDFGCSELGFLRYLKNMQGVEEILCVDIDRQVLEYNKAKAEPYLMEYVCCRKTPLVIELCEGSVTHHDRKLEQTDAVICIELIEHLYPDTLMDLPFNIFEYIMPKVAIVTTPNADFNVLFSNFSGFRHPDHKFEWTRKQFQDWAQNIVVKYPSYSVTFHEICKGPAGTEKLGACTQMAVFHRNSLIEECNKIIGVDGLFKIVARYDYPIYVDNRSDEEKLLHEATYHIMKLAYTQEIQDEVLLSDVLPYLKEKNFNVTIEMLKNVLIDANWIIKNREDGPIVKIDVSSSDCEDEDENFHIDNTDLINEENVNELNYEYETLANEISSNVDEQNPYIESWDEQPSIIIPENRSIIQENTYLFDGEHFLSEYQSPEESHKTGNSDINRHSKINNITESLIYTERELPSNSTSFDLNETEMNNKAEMIDVDMPPVFDTSQIISDSRLKFKNSSVDNKTKELTPSQNNDINLKAAELPVQEITLFNFQPYKSSTSLEPDFFSFESNNSLHSANYQNGSCDIFHQFSLNNIFYQSEMTNKPVMNIEESTAKDKLSLPCEKSSSEKDGIHKSEIDSSIHMFSNCSKINDSCNFEQMISFKNQVYEKNDMADTPYNIPLNICSSSNSANNQPRFTSSPKASIKTSTNIIKQNCPELKEHAVNRNILPCTKEAIKKTVSNSNSSSLKDINQKSSNTITEQTLCAKSLSNDITNISKNNVDLCLISNNAQQHLCLENKEFTEVVNSKQGTDEKFVKRNIVINCESDFAYDIQNIDAHHSLSSNNENIDNKEENMCCTLTKTNDNGTNAHQENVIDFAQSNIRKKSLNPPKELSSFKSQNSSECSSTECAKKTSVLENDRFVSSSSNKDANNVQFASVLKKNDEIVGTSKDVNTSNIVGLVNNIEAKSVSPFETPPNSWSPEIMDSGYPNSASVQDITPEYDLSSIAQDHIPDSESPSIAEAPRLGVLEPIEVENGDLANNNRDDEGNNMMAVDANDIENLQPFIDVLENDLENENDIYVMQNGFPIWLLRLLDMANPLDMQGRQNLRDPEDEIADDANYVGRDEGFDSSSSENESDI